MSNLRNAHVTLSILGVKGSQPGVRSDRMTSTTWVGGGVVLIMLKVAFYQIFLHCCHLIVYSTTTLSLYPITDTRVVNLNDVCQGQRGFYSQVLVFFIE